MSRCEDCGKLFSPAPDKPFCDACVRKRLPLEERVRETAIELGEDSPEELALVMGIPVAEIAAVLKRIELPGKDVPVDAICARCKKEEATSSSPFCVGCLAALDKAFGNAARELEEKIAMAERKNAFKTSAARMNTREALERKRLRTTDHGRPRR